MNDVLTELADFLTKSVYPFFLQPTTPIALALLILTAGIAVTLFVWLARGLPALRRLRRLRDAIRATPGPAEFPGAFGLIDEAFGKVQFLSHGWEEFKETLVFPPAGSSDPVFNTARPGFYLNGAAAEANGLRLRFYQAIPSYFVGIGLLLTFLGLVAALDQAQGGLSGAQQAGQSAAEQFAKMQESLRGLLAAASFKFLTSIAGILSSLMLGFVHRVVTHRVTERIEEVAQELESRLAFVTLEALGLKQVKQLEAQTLALERLNTDFAFSVARELDTLLGRSLPQSIGTAVHPVVTAINGMAERMGQSATDAAGELLGHFQQNLQQTAGEEFRQLAKSLQQSQATLAELATTIQGSGSTMAERIEQAGKRLEMLAEGAGNTLKINMGEAVGALRGDIVAMSEHLRASVSDAGSGMAGSINSASNSLNEAMAPLGGVMQRFSTAVESLSSGFSEQKSALDDSLLKIRDMSQAVDRSAKSLRESAAPFEQSAAAIRSSSENISRAAGTMGQLQQQLHGLTTTLKETSDGTRSAWQAYAGRFEQVDDDLERIFEQFASGVRGHEDQILKFVGELNKHHETAIRSLQSGIEDLTNVVEELDEVLRKVRA